MDVTILFAAIAAFLVSFVGTWKVKIYMERAGITGIDQQKLGKPRIASSGGIAVLSGFLTGTLLTIALDTFYFHTGLNVTLVLAASTSVLIAAMIGFLDDIYMGIRMLRSVTGTDEYRIGLKQWQKPLLILAAAIPLMVVRAGTTSMLIPFVGTVNFWIFYPIVLVPLAVVCVSNAFNMLAGMNGLEAGLGFVASFTLGVYILLFGNVEGAVIAFALAFALLAFLKYNWYPAKILPGDSLTYMVGTAFVAAVVIGNVEKFGIIIALPWIVESFLKLRARFKASSLGILQPDGILKSRYDNVYSLTHLVMKSGRFRENQIALLLILTEVLICAVAFVLFYAKII
jgi:UDP-N-acetylglucosamine--dolichyl-phosphate N-acetylglucosaminephosphotransferase